MNNYFETYTKICEKKYKEFQKYVLKKNHKEYENTLKNLANILNQYHKTNYNEKRWNFLIGPWLKNSIDIFQHKQIIIKKQSIFKKFYKNQKTNTLTLPHDYTDFMNNLNNKIFNENLFRYSIYKNSNFRFQIKDNNKFNFYKLIKNLLILIRILAYRLFLPNLNNKIIILDSSFIKNKKNYNKFYNLKKKILYPHTNIRLLINSFISKKINFSKRLEIIQQLKKKDKKNYMLIYILATIPINYLENFYFVKLLSSIIFEGKNFYSRVAHLDNELFKTFRLNNDLNLEVDQHGGNYSFTNFNLYLYYEKKYANKIYFWDKINNKMNKSKFNSLKIYNRNSFSYKKKKYNVCYHMSFIKEFDYQNTFHKHFDYNHSIFNLKQFYKYIQNKEKLIIKLPPNRHEYQITKSSLIKLKFKQKNLTYNEKDIYNSKIIVFDDIGTALFETRSNDLPFIILIKKNNYFLSKEGEYIIKLLKKDSLLFEKSKTAAEYLNNISNLDHWWNSKKKTVSKIFYNFN